MPRLEILFQSRKHPANTYPAAFRRPEEAAPELPFAVQFTGFIGLEQHWKSIRGYRGWEAIRPMPRQ